ncbi:MAG: gamma-glutamyl-gamma-aminobutyrate hydrolase family protein [Rhizobiales bacterium]|nr:gamma-glutamyl-gamma-aminobutyrate hydrolase family protein [Hyphomicrobiales bacterium]
MTRERNVVLLTQRVEVVASYGERRDALDQAWMKLLSDLGCDGFAAANDASTALHQAQVLAPDLIILTGGNAVLPGGTSHAPERNDTEAALLGRAADLHIPVLGVCRGFQFLNVHLGGTLRHLEGHVASTHTVGPFADGIRSVNSYHNLGMMPDDLSTELNPIALAPDGSVEAASHRRLPWAGIMWHPERAMPDDGGTRRWFAGIVARLINRKAAFDID